MGIGEGRSASGKAVYIRGLHHRMSPEVADPVVLIVDRDKEDVGPGFLPGFRLLREDGG